MNVNENKIMELFPKPLYINNIDEPLIDQLKNYLLNAPKIPNAGNLRSKDGRVLEHPLFAGLKKTVNECIKKFVDILYPGADIDVYITQSWANFTEPLQHHHRHTHPNSFISGIFYVSVIKDEDVVQFFKDTPPTYFFNARPNNYNYQEVSIRVETGDLLLFPSDFTHYVPPTTSKETRISLSFNTFIRGNIGDEMSSTALYLR